MQSKEPCADKTARVFGR
jgi:hypothetical protein